MDLTRRTVLASVSTAAAVGLAGCGGGDTETPESTETDESMDTEEPTATEASTDTAAGSGAATVQVSDHPDLGEILVGPEEMTLYMFDQDEQGAGESSCTEGCLENWPALTVDDESTAGDGVTAELSTFTRADGDTQVAADGWPLYYFTPDEEPGDVQGQGVNDVWWVLRADGSVVRDDGGETDTETETDGRY